MAFTTSALLRMEPTAYDGNIPADTLVAQALVDARKRKLDRDTDVVANPRRCSAVPPRQPSIAMMSAPLRAMPLAIAAMLWTAATFTMIGFV